MPTCSVDELSVSVRDRSSPPMHVSLTLDTVTLLLMGSKALGYIRQLCHAAYGYGLAAQEADIRKSVKSHGLKLTQVFRDEGVSGSLEAALSPVSPKHSRDRVGRSGGAVGPASRPAGSQAHDPGSRPRAGGSTAALSSRPIRARSSETSRRSDEDRDAPDHGRVRPTGAVR